MEKLKSNILQLEKLCTEVLRGLNNAKDLDDEDLFEAEFQLDKSLKGMKVLRSLVQSLPTVDGALKKSEAVCDSNIPLGSVCKEVEGPGGKAESYTYRFEVNIERTSSKTMNNEFLEVVEVKNDLDEDPNNGYDDENNNDDVLTAFLDEDDEDFDNLDSDNVVDNENKVDDELDAVSSDDDTDEVEIEDDPDVEPPTPKHRQTLKQHFGHKSFRPFQWSIISGILNERVDQCVIMATGYGKSLCYQYPSVYTGRTTVVVSPLISLMTDQVASLRLVNIPATYLGSAQEKSVEVKRNIACGQYRIVYVTPEFMTGAGGNDILKQLNASVGIELIAIDEAHCVSQWGHDFRTSYQKLGCLKKMLPDVPILAVTATATPSVRNDICRSLGLRNPKMTCTSFDRKNLRFSVQPKVEMYTDLKSQMTLDDNGKYCFDGPTIIYCPTKKSTEEVTEMIRKIGILCARYHSGLSLSERKKAHEDFVADRIQAIVATVAFGMGIDKPDVRLIIHYGAPKDLESYYQETGRAGRDGGASACVAFYAQKDFHVNRMILSDIQNKEFLEHKTEMLQKMQAYLSSTHCRRKIILKHFDGKAKSSLFGKEDCCDNCASKLQRQLNGSNSASNAKDDNKLRFGELFDFGKDAKLLMDAIVIFRQKFGLGAAVALVTGSSDKRAVSYRNSKVFGAGKYRSQKWWMTFGRMLLNAGYLAEERVSNGFGSTVCFTEKGQTWFERAATKPLLKLEPNHELLALEKVPRSAPVSTPAVEIKILPSVPCKTWLSTKQLARFTAPTRKEVVDGPEEKELQGKLYAELMKLRNTLAEEQSVAPYMVASNKNLVDLAKFRPTDRDNLARIEDLPEVKQEKFGQKFIECVSKFCSDKSAVGNRFPEELAAPVNEKVSPQLDQEVFMQLPVTARTTYSMLQLQGMTVDQVCKERGIKPSTVAGHMACAIKYGIHVDVEKFGVTDRIRKLIVDTIRAPPINSDISKRTPIKEALPPEISWEQLNIVIAILEWQFGITGLENKALQSPPPQCKPDTSASPDSQDSQVRKRSLPAWMSNGSSAAPVVKKQKSSLFRR